MTVFEKIAAQQGQKNTPVWMVGEQLKDMIRDCPGWQELVDQDLDNESMSLAECEKKIKDYADKHRNGNFACVVPSVSEKIIRDFYGLTDETRGGTAEKIINLADFF
nr:MAG TPA: hypothetical protein [Caudoviricetes sp.]